MFLVPQISRVSGLIGNEVGVKSYDGRIPVAQASVLIAHHELNTLSHHANSQPPHQGQEHQIVPYFSHYVHKFGHRFKEFEKSKDSQEVYHEHEAAQPHEVLEILGDKGNVLVLFGNDF